METVIQALAFSLIASLAPAIVSAPDTNAPEFTRNDLRENGRPANFYEMPYYNDTDACIPIFRSLNEGWKPETEIEKQTNVFIDSEASVVWRDAKLPFQHTHGKIATQVQVDLNHDGILETIQRRYTSISSTIVEDMGFIIDDKFKGIPINPVHISFDFRVSRDIIPVIANYWPFITKDQVGPSWLDSDIVEIATPEGRKHSYLVVADSLRPRFTLRTTNDEGEYIAESIKPNLLVLQLVQVGTSKENLKMATQLRCLITGKYTVNP